MIATLPCNPYHDGNNASKMGKERGKGKKQEMELFDVQSHLRWSFIKANIHQCL
jgi:hypothetical protein